MKKVNNFYILIVSLIFTSTSFSQVLVNTDVETTISNSNVFLDGSQFAVETGALPYVGKGMIIPSVDLVNFQFDLTLVDGATFPTYFDGMVVYNSATGNTLTTGNRSSISAEVVPGFFYFSNPDGAANGTVTGGQWLPVGGPLALTKQKRVVNVVLATASADLPLGTGVIAANEVKQFIGAKIYTGTAPNLVLVNSATTDYNKTNNTLTVGNGIIYQALPAGTYTVVVDYK